MVVVFLVDEGGGDPSGTRVQILCRTDEVMRACIYPSRGRGGSSGRPCTSTSRRSRRPSRAASARRSRRHAHNQNPRNNPEALEEGGEPGDADRNIRGRGHLPLSDSGDGGHVEQLTGVILDSAQHDHGDGVTFLLDGPQDVLRPQSLLPLSRRISVIPRAPGGEGAAGAATLPGAAAAAACSPEACSRAGGSATPRHTEDVQHKA